jgi:hypothetical protein
MQAQTLPFQTNFTAGELSPRLEGRVDVSKYHNGLRTCRNFLVFVHGGATRRPGTHFVAEVKTSSKKTRLLPFEFSDTQAYIVEAGESYFRFYKDSGRIENPPGTPVEISTPYLEAELPDLKHAQSADVMYLVHAKHHPRKLTRTSHTAWTLTQLDNLDGPYLEEKVDITFTPSATTGNGITITASTAFFEAGHVGALLRLKHSSTWGYAKITAVASSTSATADVKSAFGSATASASYREGAWSTKRGFPRAVTFHEGRLYFGGTDFQPQVVHGSVTNDFENFAPSKTDGTVLDTSGVSYPIAANKVNVIRWLMSTRVLLVGTLGAEHALKGDLNKGLTPSSAAAKGESTYGSSRVQAQRVDDVVLFVQRSGRKIRELVFSFDTDSYKAPNLTLLAEHLLPSSAANAAEMAWQTETDPILWVVRADGVLLGMTYDRTQEVAGWHQHTTDGKFESVAVIPHHNLDRDQTWVIVNRTINAATKRYVEFLDDKGNPFAAYGALNVDSGLTYDAAPATTFTGLSHLEAKTVKIVGDGAVYPDKTVTSGQVTITPAASKVEIGLGYTSTLETHRPEVPLPGGGTSQGRKKRWAEVVVRLHNTLGVTVLGDFIPFRSSADDMGEPPALFSGDRRKTNLGWERDGRVKVEQTQPLPCTVLGIAGILEVTN